MNVLLTGGAGYIGSHVVLSLIDAGHDVHIIDNLSTGTELLIPKDTPFTKCDIDDQKTITSLIQNNKFDLLMHFAGYIQVEESVKKPNKYFENNTNKAVKLFETCKENGLVNIVFSSTAAVYGFSKENDMIPENQTLNPNNPYAESKLKTERYLRDNSSIFNFIILRYFNVAGADPQLRSGQISKQSTHLIKILSEIVVGKRNKLEIFGDDYDTPDGTAIRDYIHVSDLADIHVEIGKYLLKTLNSNTFNCGYGKGFSVLEVLETAKQLGEKINFIFANRRDGDVEKLVSDISKLKKTINWTPNLDSLEKIISSSIEWEKKLSEKNL